MLTGRFDRRSAALSVVFAANGAAVFSWLPRLPDLQSKLAIDVPTVAWIAFAASLGGIVGSQAAPWVMRKSGTTPTIAIGAVALLAGTGLSAVTFSPLMVGVVIAVAGLGDGLEDVAMNAAGVSHQTAIGRPIMQRLHAAWSAGALVGALFATAAASWRVPLSIHIIGANAVLLALTAWALVSAPTGEPPHRIAVTERFRRNPHMRRSVLVIGVAVALVAIVEGIPSEWPPVLLTNERGVSPGAASAATTVFLAAMFAARLTGDHLIARFGNRTVLVAGIVTATVGSFIGFGLTSPTATYVGVILMGAGGAYAIPTLFTIAGTDPHIGPGDGAALVSGVARVGFLSYPPLIAWLEPQLGLGVSLQTATVAGVMVIVLVRVGLPEPEPRQPTTLEKPTA